MIRCAAFLLALAAVTGCGENSSSDDKTSGVIPAGWQTIEPLAGGEGRPRVSAALPQGLRKTTEVGIDSQMASYVGPDVSVQFDYGAASHPGCPAGVAQCVLHETVVAGRPAKMSVAEAGAADLPFRSVYTYFAPLEQGSDRTSDSSNGTGLLVTVKCLEGPTCQVADKSRPPFG